MAWGTLLALAVALLTGILRTYIWILGLEPVALGVVLGEAAAVPSSVRHRRPPRWSYAYIFTLGLTTYVLVHLVFWLTSVGVLPSESFLQFLQGAPSATATPFFQSVDLARDISLATGGATAIKYWIWAAEGLLLAGAATLAYRGGSVRLLKG